MLEDDFVNIDFPSDDHLGRKCELRGGWKRVMAALEDDFENYHGPWFPPPLVIVLDENAN